MVMSQLEFPQHRKGHFEPVLHASRFKVQAGFAVSWPRTRAQSTWTQNSGVSAFLQPGRSSLPTQAKSARRCRRPPHRSRHAQPGLKSAVFHGIRAKLIEHEGEWKNGIGRHVDIDARTRNRLFRRIEWLDGCRQDCADLGRGPVRLQKQIMNAPERARDGFRSRLALLNALSRPKAEGRYGLHRGQNVLHPMMQFFQQDALQLPGNLLLCGVDARFRQQRRRSEFSAPA